MLTITFALSILRFMAIRNKKQTKKPADRMVGVRVPPATADRYHALARQVDHRKLTDVLRLLLDGWAEEMEAKKRSVA